MGESIMIKLYTDGDFISMSTYCRRHGRHGRFMFGAMKIRETIVSRHTIFDSDCGSYAELYSDYDDLHICICWLSEDSGDRVHGIKQRIAIPIPLIEQILQAQEMRIKIMTKYLYQPPKPRATIVTSGALSTLRRVQTNKLKRRALSKAMRDCLRWPGYLVRLYSDGADDFFFQTCSGYKICGGLILHESEERTRTGSYPKLQYSVHT